MKNYLYAMCLLLAASTSLTSCLNKDEEIETDDYCYISSFSLGTLKRTLHTVSSENTDSSYTTSFSGTLFPMTIDHRTLTIENRDSLPIGTRVNQALATVAFNGVLAYRKAEPATAEDTVWTTYSTSDSIDFSKPLHFACAASNGNSYRIYTVKVNVHQQKGDSTTWDALGHSEALANMGERKALMINDQLVVLGENGSGSLSYAQHANTVGGNWITLTTTGTEGANIRSLQRMGKTLFLSNESGQILTSTNAVDWTVSSFPSQSGLQLVGASEEKLYALCDNKLLSSNGSSWTEEKMDASADHLPISSINAIFTTTANGSNNLLLMGNDGKDSRAVVWMKSWQKGQEDAEEWMFYTPNQTDKYRCPLAKDLNALAYDGGFIAFGGASASGDYAAMSAILYSKDHGITWKPYDNDDMLVDAAIQEAAETTQYVASTVDAENHVWIILDGKVWRGRINRLGFLRQDPS